ncbi:MAG: N-acetylmuramoyl-L-alanine amidase [Lachnospiraceae bacterium]|nr:N-acetylmuramoyl-L-alanine amidase [Lachnospiraceae bacterium]
MAVMTKREWLRRRQKRRRLKKLFTVIGLVVIILLILLLVIKFFSFLFGRDNGIIKKAGDYKINQQLLTEYNNTRSGQSMDEVKYIVIHDSGDPTANAASMRDYYESIGKAGTITESVHFIIDTDGTITQLIPCNEIAFHALDKNKNSIAIQFCYMSEDGSMSSKTYNAMKTLCVKLCKEYKLSADAILTHYEVTQKECPKYYVANNESWEKFKADVNAELK